MGRRPRPRPKALSLLVIAFARRRSLREGLASLAFELSVFFRGDLYVVIVTTIPTLARMCLEREAWLSTSPRTWLPATREVTLALAPLPIFFDGWHGCPVSILPSVHGHLFLTILPH